MIWEDDSFGAIVKSKIIKLNFLLEATKDIE